MMNARVIFCLPLAFLVPGGQTVTVTVTNNCPDTIWPATLANANFPQLAETGFELPSKQTRPLNIPARWEGRFWVRTGCSNVGGRFTCATADCGSGHVECNGNSSPFASLVEMKFASDGGQDFYNLSLVDGYNLALAVAPQGGTGPKCARLGCSGVNEVCPAQLQVKDGANVIACKSACTAFHKPEYCCTDAYKDTCPPTNFSQIFKGKCPEAYSYAKDDQSSVFSCYGGPTTPLLSAHERETEALLPAI